ncbi:MAG: signal recognition particle-docking protein FtsY [Amphiplicatus sp.]
MAKSIFSGLFGKKGDAPPGEGAPEAPHSPSAPAEKKGFFSRLTAGLSKSSNKLSADVAAIFNKKKLDNETLEALEELLIAADLGVAAAAGVALALAKDRFDKNVTDEEARAALAQVVAETLRPLEAPLAIDRARKPHVILVAGVNGAGKTTTIGKLAAKFKADGLSVMLAAGDTFRAAAIEQLSVWGARAGAAVVARAVGSDAAGLAYDALQRAKAEGVDVLLIDTAGRLQNKRELMDELAKIVRVLKKLDETAPHDVVLVLDATVGQNALSQAETFREIAGVTGLVMTKLDGTARGGVLVALANKFHLPIHFIGVGEAVEDLQPFKAESFARALAGLGAPAQSEKIED